MSVPYQAHSETSKAAAESMRGNKLRVKVLDFLKAQPAGATDEEIQIALAMNPSTQRPRRIELVALEEVVDSGMRRPTKSGRSAVVWCA